VDNVNKIMLYTKPN